MTNTEDTAPQFSDYPYSWASGCSMTLDDFLKKVRTRLYASSLALSGEQRPSMVEDDGTKPVSAKRISAGWLLKLGLVDLGERLGSIKKGGGHGRSR